jgi:hypothetical protein
LSDRVHCETARNCWPANSCERRDTQSRSRHGGKKGMRFRLTRAEKSLSVLRLYGRDCGRTADPTLSYKQCCAAKAEGAECVHPKETDHAQCSETPVHVRVLRLVPSHLHGGNELGPDRPYCARRAARLCEDAPCVGRRHPRPGVERRAIARLPDRGHPRGASPSTRMPPGAAPVPLPSSPPVPARSAE